MARDWFPPPGFTFPADLLAPGGIGIDGTKTGNTVLATVPANRHAIVQTVALVSCVISGFTSGPTISVGVAGNLAQIVASVSIGTNVELRSGFLNVLNNIPLLNGGDQLILRVSVAAVSTEYSFAAFPVGILIW